VGTRGACGLRKNSLDKVTYCHFDSYPKGLGKDMIGFVRNTSLADLNAAYDRLTLVNNDDVPTGEQIAHCQTTGAGALPEYPNLQDGWYSLLREEQGYPEKWLTGSGFMIDNHDFLAESLFCEWAYIVNLDEKTLEFYRGFNKDPKGSGRYAHLLEAPSNDYYGKPMPQEWYGVTLITAVPIAVIQEATEEMIADLVTKLEDENSVWEVA
jgi:hypothetical protein